MPDDVTEAFSREVEKRMTKRTVQMTAPIVCKQCHKKHIHDYPGYRFGAISIEVKVLHDDLGDMHLCPDCLSHWLDGLADRVRSLR